MTRMTHATRAAAGHVLHLVLPPACHGCGRPARGDEPELCAACRTRLREPPHPRCARCDAPRGTGLDPRRACSECDGWPAALASARAAVVMAPPADALVHGLKYGGWPELAPFMAERMARAIQGADLDAWALVVPVPTTPSRVRQRGYNQAELLARELGAALGLPSAVVLGRRDGATTQTALHRAERIANVHDAFHALSGGSERVAGREVLLVDDVLTTGATAVAAATALVGAGAARIRLVVFARALPSDG